MAAPRKLQRAPLADTSIEGEEHIPIFGVTGIPRRSEDDETTPPEFEIYRSEFRNVKLPTLWRHCPHLWFVRLECEFQVFQIRSDEEKFCAVLRYLDEDIMSVVADFFVDPPVTEKYEALKQIVISRVSDLTLEEYNTLFSEVVLGDRSPSALLREMRTLVGSQLPDSMLKTLWKQRLPDKIQKLLFMLDDISLTKLAECADKVLEPPTGFSAAAVTMTPHQIKVNKVAEQIQALAAEVAGLQLEVHSRPSDRGRSKSRRRPSRSRGQYAICYYHRMFGEKARCCIEPCDALFPLAQPENRNGRLK